MKRYLRLAAWCLGLALAVTACGRAGRIVLPEAAEVTAIRVTAGDAVTLHTDRDWIGEFLQQAAEAVSTGMESVQDAPDQTGAVKVELGTGETPDWSVLYVYEAEFWRLTPRRRGGIHSEQAVGRLDRVPAALRHVDRRGVLSDRLQGRL